VVRFFFRYFFLLFSCPPNKYDTIRYETPFELPILTWLFLFFQTLLNVSTIDYIAECVDTFLTEQGLDDQEIELNLGYTFSFPVLQSKVNKQINL
jgi:hypothetical protein